MRSLKLSLCLAGLLSSGAAFAEVPGWKISESSGQVAIVSPGVSKIAHRGGAVAVGEIVATGTNGRAVLVRGEEYLIVSPNTRIRVADPAQTGGMTQIIEIFGNTIFKIKKMATPHFAVQTPYLAAVVKGTTFSVTVTDKGATVQVVEGRVEVSTRDGGASYMVLPGDIGSVTAGAPMRLNLEGRESRAIISTGPRPEAVPVAPEPEEPKADKAASAPLGVSSETVISAAVGEGPVKLETLSGGLMTGDTAMVAMMATEMSEPVPASPSAEVPAVPAETVVQALPPTPVALDPVPVEVVALPPTPVSVAPVETVIALPPVSAVPVTNVNATPTPATLATPVDVVVASPAPVDATAVGTPPVVAVTAPVAPVVTAPVVVAIAAPVPVTPTPAVSTPVVPVVVAVVTPVSNSGPGNNNAGGNGNGQGNGNCPNCTGANLPPVVIVP
jgi:FecR protein